jgi:heme-degrading monooxygenase HmoA
MFCVLFEVHPKPDRWDAYLGYAKSLKPELERIDGFIENIRYRSLTREGWLLSLSSWRDEKSLIRWRTQAEHHEVQRKGRSSQPPEGHVLREERLDETAVGAGTTVTLIDAKRPQAAGTARAAGHEVARWLGLAPAASGLVAWDVFDAVLTPGDVILPMSWRDQAAAEAFERSLSLRAGARLRRVRVVRDYGMFDRREAPQYYAAVEPTG